MAARTNLDGLDLDKPYPITEINARIPRGGAIESIFGIDMGGA